MRWSVLYVLLLVSASVYSDAALGSNNETVTATVSVSALGPRDAALALQNVVILVLREAGVKTSPVDPEDCDITDEKACVDKNLKKISSPVNSAPIAIVTVPPDGTPSAWGLFLDTSIKELAEITPPFRRSCLATAPPARSLLDLTDPTIAAAYNVPDDVIQRLKPCNELNCQNSWVPEWCTNTTCATILTSTKVEARVLQKEITQHHLYAVVSQLGDRLPEIASYLASRPIIVCDWAPEVYLPNFKAKPLGPPTCEDSPCPFETRRVVMYINMLYFSRAPSAVHALAKLKFTTKDMRILAIDAQTKGPLKAAEEYMAAHPLTGNNREVRITVMIPTQTTREAYNPFGLFGAATKAEKDVNLMRSPGARRLKIKVFDSQCNAQAAYKYLADEPGSGMFGAVSAIVGPACSAAWADVPKQAAVHTIPVLAYTPQAPAVLPQDLIDTRIQLLAAGDARDSASAMAALLGKLGWRRVAALNEPATRPLLDAIRMHAKLVVHTEIPENGSNIGLDRIQHWANQAANESARILYLCVEDGRLARAALCAARTAGGVKGTGGLGEEGGLLSPRAGAVWLVCSPHQPDWLIAKPGEDCTTKELEEMAEGHFSVTSEWTLDWHKGAENASEERKKWEADWRIHCNIMRDIAKKESFQTYLKHNCDAPDHNAAMLYDTLRQWALALYKLLEKDPLAADDLHNRLYANTLINYTTTSEFNGLSGPIKWNTVEGAHARVVSLILSQWDSKLGPRPVGTWTKDSFELNNTDLIWYTSDGQIPDDGSENCALQGLADALHADCRIAFVALCTILVAILILIVTAIALHCKRRAEKEYRKRLQLLGMRPLAIKPAGLDRWEVPRERVVINRKLGTGAFGTVYGGHALLAEDRGWSAVAVKTLKAGATTEEKLDFLSEAEAMKRFDHKNVVRLLGVVTKTEPVCTVMEFMLYGDLKNYLLARRHLAMVGGCTDAEGLEADEASPRRLTSMALDVARALSYLAQLRYVHRDVAARNCLVSARRTVKLADFGMTRLVFENDYYRFSRKGMLPVRWMAPESLALGVFSPASDVWSFGVLLYEIVTFGSLPFQGLSNSEVLSKVKGGRTLDLPQGLKPQLEGLIKSCWQQDPKTRPTASEVAAFLADAPRLLTPCLDVPLDALPMDADPPWRLPRDQAEARWVSWAAPASAATDSTYVSADGAVPLETDNFLA